MSVDHIHNHFYSQFSLKFSLNKSKIEIHLNFFIKTTTKTTKILNNGNSTVCSVLLQLLLQQQQNKLTKYTIKREETRNVHLSKQQTGSRWLLLQIFQLKNRKNFSISLSHQYLSGFSLSYRPTNRINREKADIFSFILKFNLLSCGRGSRVIV